MNNDRKKIDDDVRAFIEESREILDEIEPRIIRLGQRLEDGIPADAETVNRLFRAFHTIKGTAAFYQFDIIVSVTHKAETLLDLFRKNGIALNISCTDLLCKSCDVIEQLFKFIEETGSDEGADEQVKSIRSKLTGIMNLLGGRSGHVFTETAVEGPDAAEPPETAERKERRRKKSRLFLKEAISYFEEILMMTKKFSRLKEDIPIVEEKDLKKTSENLKILTEAADFLQFEYVVAIFVSIKKLIDFVKKRGGYFPKQAIEVFGYGCDVAGDLLKIIETEGDDRGHEEQINMVINEIENSFLKIKSDEIFPGPSLSDNSIKTDPDKVSVHSEKKILPKPEKIENQAGKEESSAVVPPLYNEIPQKPERRDIRVSLDKLDELINLLGELVIAENMVVRNPDVVNMDLENFERASVHLSKIVRELQNVALSVRMIPISGIFRKMFRLVHDLSIKSGKKIGLKIIGEDTEIDKTVAELIADPLVHLIRNAVDHGINKKRTGVKNDGNILLEARHEGGEVWILIKDDGEGLDIRKILEKGIEGGFVSGDGQYLSDQEITELIFHPGFSTSEIVTSVSGRGVGMDVVKRNIEAIRGKIDIYSKPGQGTTFIMKIPLTLAIIDGMLVRVGASSYTIPLLSIRESVQIDETDVVTTMDGQEMVRIRNELLSVIRLHEIYEIDCDYKKLHEGIIVIIEHQWEAACLFIDEIIGEQQTVIKGLSGYMENIRGVSGCTILGDGEVSLILDVAGLIKRVSIEPPPFNETGTG